MEAACSEIGSIMLPHGRCINAGQFELNEKLGVYLYETSRFTDLMDIPGKRLGAVVIVNNRIPETFREAKSIIHTCRAYTNTLITIVANVHPNSTGEPWTQQDFRFALQIDSTIPIIECDVSDLGAVKSVLDNLGQRFLAQGEDGSIVDTSPSIDVIDEADFFTSDKVHRFLTVVGTDWVYRAHESMDQLSDQITWLKLDNRSIPRRWGYCDLDPTMRLHFIPVEQFGMPKNSVAFMIQSLEAMASGQLPSLPVEEHSLPYNEGTIGCIGLFNSYDEASVARTRQLIKVFGNYPYLLIDTGRGSINEPTVHNQAIDEAYLGASHSIMRVDSRDPYYPKRAVCLLNEQLSGLEAEKLRLKFDCLR
jgi:hypothetical protein